MSRHAMNIWRLGLLCGALWAALPAGAALSVHLTPQEASRFIYEPFSLLLQSDQSLQRPNVPDGPGYNVTEIREVPSGYQIELIANEAGTLTILPFAVTSDQEQAKTPVLRLPVGAPHPANQMRVAMAFSQTNTVVGEPIDVTITWETDVPFVQYQELQFAIPILNDPNWDAYYLPPEVPEEERIGLPINNQRVIAKNATNSLQFSCQLIPKKAGTYPTDAQLSCALLKDHQPSCQYPSYFDNDFFSVPDKQTRFERIYLSEAGPQLAVQPLPTQGRSARFSGIVGPCDVAASIEPADTIVGQPMLLRVALTDLTFSKHIANLPEATLDGLGSEFSITREPMHVQSGAHTKTFTYIVRPLRSGLNTLPALVFDVFDPTRQTYRTVRTDPLPISIAPDGKQTIYTPIQKPTPMTPLTGIRHNRKENGSTMYAFFEFLSAHGWAFWLLPPLLYPVLRPWLRRRDRCRVDPAYARALRATAQFKKQIRDDEELAWRGWFADRFNLTAEAITFKAVQPHLEQLDSELIEAVKARFSAEETNRYAPPGTPKKKGTAARKLIGKLNKALPVLLLAMLCMPAPARAQSAKSLFEQAQKIQAQRPDEAEPLFTEAALQFESQHQFFNAANSWFFAGQNGRALANYRAAESRRPYDSNILESIQFIQTQRADHFEGDAPSSGAFHALLRAWNRLERWSISLRFGALTLLYALGWSAFLIARLLAKPIPRKAWALLGLGASTLLASLLQSALQPANGVIIQSTEARLGPGYAYQKAYESLLHDATEFEWLDERNDWVYARFADDQTAWLRKTACIRVR